MVMGLVKRRNRFYFEFFDTDKTPKSKRYSLRTKSRKAAELRALTIQTAWKSGEYDPWAESISGYEKRQNRPQHMDLECLVGRFMDDKSRLGRSPETLRTYEEVLSGMMRYLEPVREIGSISPDWLSGYIHAQDVASATRIKRYGHIRTFVRWMKANHGIDMTAFSLVPKPLVGKILPKSVSRLQLEALCSALRLDYERKLAANTVRPGQIIWKEQLFTFAFATGLRISELARLSWEDVDLDGGILILRCQKNGDQGKLPLSRISTAILADTPPNDRVGWVFSSPGNAQQSRSVKRFCENAGKTFRRYRDEAGLPRELSVHGLRHGFCTHLAQQGKSAFVISQLARHKDIATSMRYVHLNKDELRCHLNDAFSNG